MPKKVEKIKPEEPNIIPVVGVSPSASVVVKNKVAPLTQEFGNGEINVLRDKLNEVINSL